MEAINCSRYGWMYFAMLLSILSVGARANTNKVYSPCMDATVHKNDGFTFGLAFASNKSFFYNKIQLSPCDSRLAEKLREHKISLFRPQVDEVTLLLVNHTEINPENVEGGGFAVAYAGKKHAVVSAPHFLANSSYRITSLSLVLNFEQGRLQNILWKNDGCKSCLGNSSFACVRGECAIQSTACIEAGGRVDCSLSIQLTWSGTDQRQEVLNSWYQMSNLNQYSLYGLYSNLKSTLTDRFSNMIRFAKSP
ncbi:uncharacterized protein [Physcomitrium patens]|uniref:Expp1 protein n=1 Tax=Physcomitrium patens TaxID=3218 RepID=A9S7N0_PHYPA|nr:uncharacterized protein LOC112278262 [Physcomitrium patens]XP_024367252.1 uncharacterized protein LOC112278262 [Physcomitrium patens]PNR26228.1 hypothetical protein PHYPA_030802 [Physcomitrium patens]|eukprot:XP_024367251.1 uncharacterized protein LOC112278262 [Physcomitrella patens]